MSYDRLKSIADRLDRQGRKLEAEAVRTIGKLYGDMNLADFIALVSQAGRVENRIGRVAQSDNLAAVFNRAAAQLDVPPSALAGLLTDAVALGVASGTEMLTAARLDPEALAAFRLRPDRSIEFAGHAASRLSKFWGIEQARLKTEVQTVLIDALERGQSAEQMASRLRDRVEVSKSRSILIARNEIGNASSLANQSTQQDAGLTEYIWLTAGDARVRPEHARRNGKKFSWDNPPADGNPGEPIMCRCVALAVVPEV